MKYIYQNQFIKKNNCNIKNLELNKVKITLIRIKKLNNFNKFHKQRKNELA